MVAGSNGPTTSSANSPVGSPENALSPSGTIYIITHSFFKNFVLKTKMLKIRIYFFGCDR